MKLTQIRANIWRLAPQRASAPRVKITSAQRNEVAASVQGAQPVGGCPQRQAFRRWVTHGDTQRWQHGRQQQSGARSRCWKRNTREWPATHWCKRRSGASCGAVPKTLQSTQPGSRSRAAADSTGRRGRRPRRATACPPLPPLPPPFAPSPAGGQRVRAGRCRQARHVLAASRVASKRGKQGAAAPQHIEPHSLQA